MTIGLYARRKAISLRDVVIHSSHGRTDESDCENGVTEDVRLDRIEVQA